MREYSKEFNNLIAWANMDKAERIKHGVKTQRQLAEALGVHYVTLSRWKKRPAFRAKTQRCYNVQKLEYERPERRGPGRPPKVKNLSRLPRTHPNHPANFGTRSVQKISVL